MHISPLTDGPDPYLPPNTQPAVTTDVVSNVARTDPLPRRPDFGIPDNCSEPCEGRQAQQSPAPFLTLVIYPRFISVIHALAVLRYQNNLSEPLAPIPQDQSIIDARTRILNIMTSKPIVTMINKVKLNQPITMADVPTPDNTLPFPKSCAIMLAATDAVCCQRTDTSTKIEAMKMMAKATWLTGRLGKGLTSRSEPSLSSSSCHPGNVARSNRQMKAKIVAMILVSHISPTCKIMGSGGKVLT